MNETGTEAIRAALFSMQDPGYQAFQSALLPTVDAETVIGVRMPELRKYAKKLSASPAALLFLQELPHFYYEENNLHALLIERMPDWDSAVAALERFLPYVDNWATCDLLAPKCFSKNLPSLLRRIPGWLMSEHAYTVRFGIGMLMRYYLDEQFSADYPALVAGVRSDEYYVNMMIAWYFATALAKQYPTAVAYLEERRLPEWVHNKTIQKAVESRRIDSRKKEYLRTLKR